MCFLLKHYPKVIKCHKETGVAVFLGIIITLSILSFPVAFGFNSVHSCLCKRPLNEHSHICLVGSNNNSAGSRLQYSYCPVDLSIILSVANDWQSS